MLEERIARVLVVVERSAVTQDLLEAIQKRAAEGRVQFRLVVPNPANAEVHLLHPERHDKAAEAEHTLRESMDVIEAAAGGPVIATVSVRHDPMDAIEDVLYSEPIDEIILSVHTHGLARRFHQDLPHRLAHYGLRVVTLEHDGE